MRKAFMIKMRYLFISRHRRILLVSTWRLMHQLFPIFIASHPSPCSLFNPSLKPTTPRAGPDCAGSELSQPEAPVENKQSRCRCVAPRPIQIHRDRIISNGEQDRQWRMIISDVLLVISFQQPVSAIRVQSGNFSFCKMITFW